MGLGSLRGPLGLASEDEEAEVREAVEGALAWLSTCLDPRGMVSHWPGSDGRVALTAEALLFLTESRELWTLALGIQQLNTTEVPVTMLMAGSVIITLPVVILFFMAERYLTEGLTAGGVKG